LDRGKSIGLPAQQNPETVKFSTFLLVADVVFWLVVFGVSWQVLSRWWHRNGCRFRFSLRALLIATGILAVGAGWLSHHYRLWLRDQAFAQHPKVITYPGYCGPGWLQRLWPVEKLTIFWRTIGINLGHDFLTEEEARFVSSELRVMPHVLSIDAGAHIVLQTPDGTEIGAPLITPAHGFDAVALNSIEEVSIAPSDYVIIDEETLKVFGKLPRLRMLDVSSCMITDEGLLHLSDSQSLKSLDVSYTAITDAGVHNLRHLRKLKRLELSNTIVTDEACNTLAQLTSLVELELFECPNITDRGARRLLELPNLRGVGLPPNISEEVAEEINDIVLNRFNESIGLKP
jgi:hypothetical protein